MSVGLHNGRAGGQLRGPDDLLELVRVEIGGRASSEVEGNPIPAMEWVHGRVFCKRHRHSQRHDGKLSKLVTERCPKSQRVYLNFNQLWQSRIWSVQADRNGKIEVYHSKNALRQLADVNWPYFPSWLTPVDFVQNSWKKWPYIGPFSV
jgi:hypothetical protein